MAEKDPPVKPCVVCGKPTAYACVDCYLTTGKWNHCCTNPECRDKHAQVAGCVPKAVLSGR